MDAAAELLAQLGNLLRAFGDDDVVGLGASPDGLLSEQQAAEFLKVSRRTVSRMVNRGDLQAVRLPGTRGRRYLIEDLRASLEIERPRTDFSAPSASPPDRVRPQSPGRRSLPGVSKSFEDKLREASRGR